MRDNNEFGFDHIKFGFLSDRHDKNMKFSYRIRADTDCIQINQKENIKINNFIFPL